MEYDGFSNNDIVPSIPAIVEGNYEERTAVTLLLDISDSMRGRPIDQIHQGLEKLKALIKRDSLVASRVCISVITFGGKGPEPVTLVQDFIDGTDFDQQITLTAGGLTPMGGAVELALDKQEQFKRDMRASGGTYKRPWIVLMTDGAPTDDYKAVAARCAQMVSQGKLLFWPLATDGADHDVLLEFAGPDGHVFDVAGADLSSMFEWVGVSVASASYSSADEEVQFTAPGRIITARV
ncbi:uncharacterized protein YegL [Sphingomonas kyeonggiensis]|uniref:vWA domain-containing protein n=1 Tax=Sphingomonas kyeonggiensis TaxID=1268553 RepID=UPI00278B0F4F|nr:VWA domain-containing protein [Sphingomonas kyeonggiensis]MDQ0248401.1 uncharacterized protein YegL [Sphingomonas kyeonggiensis]